MLLGSVLVDGGARFGSIASANTLTLVREVLKKVTLVLGQEQSLGLLNDIAQVTNELSAIGGEVVGWVRQRLVSKATVHGNVDLLVLI